MTPPAPDFGFGTGTAMGSGANPDKNPIEQIYQSELGRASDEGGLSNWTNLYNTGVSLDDIRQQIGGSDEGQRYDINTMYREDLGRDADAGGLNSWVSALQGGMSLDDIRNQGIRGSEEFMNRQSTPFSPEPTFNPYTPPEVYSPYDREPQSAVYSPYDREPQPAVYPAGYDPITGTFITQRPAETQDYGFGYSGINQGIFAPPQLDPVMDFVQNIDQQLPYLQRAFQEQLQRLGDPAAAARAVLGSLR